MSMISWNREGKIILYKNTEILKIIQGAERIPIVQKYSSWSIWKERSLCKAQMPRCILYSMEGLMSCLLVLRMAEELKVRREWIQFNNNRARVVQIRIKSRFLIILINNAATQLIKDQHKIQNWILRKLLIWLML